MRTNSQKLGLAVILLLVAIMGGSGCTTIAPDEAGIIIDEWGSERGVQNYTVKTGKVTYNPFSERVIAWPIKVQRSVWTASAKEGSPENEEIVFNDRQGLVIKGDMAYAFEFRQSGLPYFYVKFKTDHVENFMDTYVRDRARGFVNNITSTMAVENILAEKGPIAKGALDSLNYHFAHMELEVQAGDEWYDSNLGKNLKATRDTIVVIDVGVHFTAFDFIGKLRPPDAVVTMIEAKINATQKALTLQNEVAQEKASAEKLVVKKRGEADARIEAARGIAEAMIEKKRGEAEGNRLLAQSITTDLMKWRRLDIDANKVARWKGEVPQISAGDSPMIIDTRTLGGAGK